MDETLKTILIVALPSLVSLILGFISLITSVRTQNRQTKLEEAKLPIETKVASGDAADKLSLGYDRLVDNLETQVANLQSRVLELERQSTEVSGLVNELKNKNNRLTVISLHFVRGIQILVNQIRDSGVEPKWTPPDDYVREIGALNGNH
jgi:hypothetical protein